MGNTMKEVIDWASALVVVGTVAKWLPAVAAVFSIIWYCVRLYDRFMHGRKDGY